MRKELVVAAAGRRVDAPGAPVRFPEDRIEAVRRSIANTLRAQGATALVSAAACGVDLLALDAAATLGMARWIVLPFAPDRFRETSVVDRPGDWGPRYDREVTVARAAGRLCVMQLTGAEEDAYLRANEAILDRAQAVAGEGSIVALVVWDGQSRGSGDVTAAFASSARDRGISVEEICTR
jgi:hypothetical protein